MGANKYDSATLVLNAAGGYKAGKIYALKPASGSGDVSYTRNSAAYRRNASGLFVSESTDVPLINYAPNDDNARFLFEPVGINLSSYNESNAGVWGAAVPVASGTIFGLNCFSILTNVGLGDNPHNVMNAQFTASKRYIASILVDFSTVTSFFEFTALIFTTAGISVAGMIVDKSTNALTPIGNNSQLSFVEGSSNQIGSNIFYVTMVFDVSASATDVADSRVYTAVTNMTSVRVAGLQVVEGRILTSYIGKNTTASATRAVAQLPLNNLQGNAFKSNEGCFLLDLARMVSNNAGDPVLTLRLANNTEVVRFIANGVANQYLVNLPTLSASTAYNAGKKIAVAWNGTNVRISQGGSIVATINGALGAVDQLRYTGTGLLEAYEMIGYPAAPTNSDLNALTA